MERNQDLFTVYSQNKCNYIRIVIKSKTTTLGMMLDISQPADNLILVLCWIFF